MPYAHTIGLRRYQFDDLRTLLARASPARSGDRLAGVMAATAQERVAAQMALAELPLTRFLSEVIIPYEIDEVTRLIIDSHNAAAFQPVSHFTVGDLRNWLLSDVANSQTLAALAPGLTPEMVAAVSKLCRLQDLVLIARKCQVLTRFRNTLGLSGRLATQAFRGSPAFDLAFVVADGLSARGRASKRRGAGGRHAAAPASRP